MTLNGAIMQLVEMRESSMVSVALKPYFDKVIETISECVEPSEIPHWIPVTERLPKRNEDVLVTRFYDGKEDFQKSCRYVEVASCYGEDEDVSWSSYSDEYKASPRNHHVIAWMPLPEPYKEAET